MFIAYLLVLNENKRTIRFVLVFLSPLPPSCQFSRLIFLSRSRNYNNKKKGVQN